MGGPSRRVGAGARRRRGLDRGNDPPGLAQTAGSVLNCEIPVPAPQAGRRKFIAADGSLVPANTPGAYPPLARP